MKVLTYSAPATPPEHTELGAHIVVDQAAVGALATERLEAELLSTAANLAAGTCRFLLLIAEYDRRGAWESWECRSAAHWLNFRCGMSMGTARDHVRVARRLIDMPLVRGEFARGALSYSKVRALARVCRPAIEADLLSIALHSTAAILDDACSKLRRVQDTAEEDAALDEAERDARSRMYLTLGDDDAGHGIGRFRIPGSDMEVLQRALATAAADLRERDDLATNAAALVELARAYLANPHTGAGPQPEIILHVDAAGLAAIGTPPPDDAATDDAATDDAATDDANPDDANPDHANPDHANSDHADPKDTNPREPSPNDERVDEHRWPIRSGMGRLFSLALLRRLACDAGLRAVADLPDGTQLDVGRHRRTPTPELRRAVKARDVSCRFPGCDTRQRLQVHHIEWWSLGGRTDRSNLLLLCSKHHHAIHDRHWTLTGTADAPEFRRADGTAVDRTPPRSDGRYDDLLVAAAQVAAAHGHVDLEVDSPGGLWMGDRIDWQMFFDGLANPTPPGVGHTPNWPEPFSFDHSYLETGPVQDSGAWA